MNEKILENILKAIQDKVEEDITKRQKQIIKDFENELERYKFRAMGEVMNNVIVSFTEGIDHQMNYSITFKKIGSDKE